MDDFEKIQHPLMIDLILEQVLSYLKEEDLLIARVVNSRWNRLASKLLSNSEFNSHKVTLTNSDQVYTFLSCYKTNLDYEDDLENPDKIWINFELDFEGTCSTDLQFLFNTCGHYMQRITILPGANINLVHLFQLLKLTPNLKELCMDGHRAMVLSLMAYNYNRSHYMNLSDMSLNRYQDFVTWAALEPTLNFPYVTRLKIVSQMEMDTSDPSFQFFHTMFQIFPALIHFESSCLDLTQHSTTVCGLVQALEKSTLLPQLQSLRIDDLHCGALELLLGFSIRTKNVLRLRKLELFSLALDVSPIVLESLIQSQAETLEELTLGGQYGQGGNQLRLTRLKYPFILPRLKTLNFSAGVNIGHRLEYMIVVKWEDLDYSRQLPQLETLGLYFCSNHTLDSIFSPEERFTPSSTVTKLDITGGVEIIGETKIQMLGQTFPNVRSLNVTVGDGSSITSVFQTWPKLRSLSMEIVDCIPKIDEYFTGAPVLDLAGELEGSVLYECFCEMENYACGKFTLLNLKDLRNLNIQMNFRGLAGGFQRRAILLSDLTGMLAIRQLSQLKELVINKSDIHPDCLRFLREELHLQKCRVGDKYGNLMDVSRYGII